MQERSYEYRHLAVTEESVGRKEQAFGSFAAGRVSKTALAPTSPCLT